MVDPLTLYAIGSAAYLIGRWAYHRLTEETPEEKGREQKIPTIKEGGAVPLVYGRCRVTPVLAWKGPYYFESRSGAADPLVGYASYGGNHRMNLFFILGIGFRSGNGITEATATNRIHNMWAGEKRFLDNGLDPTWTQTGSGAFETPTFVKIDKEDDIIDGYVSFYAGVGAQVLESGGSAVSYAAQEMMAASPRGTSLSPTKIPAYRGYLSALCWGIGGVFPWRLGRRGTSPAYTFEVSSYRTDSLYPGTGIIGRIGDDANPANVIWDILYSNFAKLNIPVTLLDMVSFETAAVALHQESHGFSRAWDALTPAEEKIKEVLQQIDGVIYEDPADNKIKLKLIRNDYNPTTIKHLTRANVKKLENLSIGGWTAIANKIKVTFTNRANEYREGSATAQNMANAVGQDNQVREEIINLPGVTHQDLADRMAARELAARSRPIMKCSAICDRSVADMVIGEAVKLTWEKPAIGGIIFRVASVDRGTLTDGRIIVELIQDYFYNYRGRVPEPPAVIDNGAVDTGILITLG